MQRQKISDPEIIELLLRSSWEHRLPGYYWASKISPLKLYGVIEEVIVVSDRYPATSEALRVASLLPRTWARALLGHAEESKRASEKHLSRKLEAVVRARTRKHIALAQSSYTSAALKFKIADGVKEVKVADLGEEIFEEILSTLPAESNKIARRSAKRNLPTDGPAISEAHVEEITSGTAEDILDRVPPS